MDIPFFLPAGAVDLAAVASMPPSGDFHEPAVVLLSGDDARNRVGVLRDVARDLAVRGHPVLRFDHPGVGMSPTDKPATRWDLLPVVLAACAWFRERSGLESLALGGTCLGARAALLIAARDPSVVVAAGMGCPIRRRKKVTPRLRAGIAAIDSIGPRVVSKLTRGQRSKARPEGWQKGLIDDITTSAPRARLEFIYGEGDEFYGDFQELLASGELPQPVVDKLVLRTLPGEQLRGLMSVEHHSWVRAAFVEALSSTEVPAS